MSFEKIDTPENDKTVIEIPVPTKKESYKGFTPIFRGQTMWEINIQTSECLPCKIKRSSMETNKEHSPVDLYDDVFGMTRNKIHHQMVERPGYFYAIAINKKNALRKFDKWRIEQF